MRSLTSSSRRRLALFLVLMVTILVSAPAPTSHAGSWVTDTYTSTYGSRDWKLFVPANYSAGTPVPLVLMLHGCTQDATSFEAGTQMSTIAEANNFLVVYPSQPSSVDQNKCWRWWMSAHQSRGSGEPALLKGLVDEIKSRYAVDPKRVYVAGFSAGAAMTSIMAATYPDVFAAALVHSGLEYKASTTDTSAAWNAMRVGGPDPKTQGELAYKASGSAHRVVPTIVIQGKSDYTVYPVNGDQAAAQALWMNNWADDGLNNSSIDATADQTTTGQVPGGYTYTRYSYNDSKGHLVGEKWMVDSMGHSWSGGSTNGSYTDPKGPKASQEMWNFFSLFPYTSCDVTVSPAPGTYNNFVDVTLAAQPANCSLYYTTDGSTPTTASPQYSAPFRLTSSATVKVLAVDSSGGQNPVLSWSYTVSQVGPVVTATPAGGAYVDSLNVTLTADLSGSTIRYTTDGTEPTTSSTLYSGPIPVTATATIKAKGWSATGTPGATAVNSYTISTISITPSPAGGTYEGPTSVSLSMNMAGTIYYTLDGSTPTTSSPVYTGPIALSCTNCPETYTLKWLGEDGAGNTGGSGSATYTINTPPPTTTVDFLAVASQDGYVYEGGASLPNSTNGYLEMGDIGLNKGQRIIISFDTTSIPDGATIVSASLTLYRYNNLYFSANGFGAIKADIRSSCFNNNCAVESADYSAASGADGVITIINIPIMDKQTAYGEITAAGLEQVSKTGTTQLRVRFENATNNNWMLDALRFYSGEATDSTVRPKLTIQYR